MPDVNDIPESHDSTTFSAKEKSVTLPHVTGIEEVEDLWPEDLGSVRVTTPLSVLKEQTVGLGRRTRQLLKAEVLTTASGDAFNHIFRIVAPTLNNYSFEIFRVYHSILLYPCIFTFKNFNREVETEDELKELIKVALADEKTKNVVTSLLSQIGQ